MNDVIFDPSGRWIIPASGGKVLFWRVERPCPIVLRGHAQGVKGSASDPGGLGLASTGSDHRIRLWTLTPEAIDVVWTCKWRVL